MSGADTLERIAAALERIAAALEVNAAIPPDELRCPFTHWFGAGETGTVARCVHSSNHAGPHRLGNPQPQVSR